MDLGVPHVQTTANMANVCLKKTKGLVPYFGEIFFIHLNAYIQGFWKTRENLQDDEICSLQRWGCLEHLNQWNKHWSLSWTVYLIVQRGQCIWSHRKQQGSGIWTVRRNALQGTVWTVYPNMLFLASLEAEDSMVSALTDLFWLHHRSRPERWWMATLTLRWWTPKELCTSYVPSF